MLRSLFSEVTFTSLQSSGKLPVDIEKLYILAIDSAVNFNILGMIASGPLALFGFKQSSVS